MAVGVAGDVFGGFGRRVGGVETCAGQVVVKVLPALCGGDGYRRDTGDVGQPNTRWCQEIEADVDDDLSPDQQVEIEGQRVEGQVDRAFDGVLDRDETEVDFTVGDGMQHFWDRCDRPQLSLRQVRLREQGLFGKGPRRPEEGDDRQGG